MVILAALGSAACGGDDADTDEPYIPPVVVNTGDTYNEPPPKLAAEVRFRAFLAWDDVLGEMVSPVIDGSTDFISAYIITLYEEGWSSDVDSTFCEVVINLEGYVEAPDANPSGFVWGIDIPEGDKDAYTDCLDKGFHPDQFEGGNPLNGWGQCDWNIRMGDDVTADMADWLTPDTPTSDFSIDNYWGGEWWTDSCGLYVSDQGSNYFYGYEMDASHNVDFDTRKSKFTRINGTGGLGLGYYVFDQSVYWTL